MRNKKHLSVSALLLFSVTALAVPAASAQIGKVRFYDIVFDGRGTYNAAAAGAGTEYYSSMLQEISMAWKTTYQSVMWDEDGGDPAEALAAGTTILSGTLVESGFSSRDCDETGSYSCQGPIDDCKVAPEIHVLKKLGPGHMFTLDGVGSNSMGVCYAGSPCSGCYTAYTAQTAHLQEGAFAATVDIAPADLKMGKVIYHVSGPAGTVPGCVDSEHPACDQSFQWSGEVTFTLVRDTLPPYIRPAATSFKAAKGKKLSLKLEAAHKQVGPASGTVTLLPAGGGGAYAQVPFKIAHDKAGASVTLNLSSRAQQLLRRKKSLKCVVSIKAKDAYGTATERTTVNIS